MKIHTDNLVIRIGATILAIGYGIVGFYSISVSGEAPNMDLADRAFWMGTTFLVAAVIALPVSWLVADLSNIWCIPPRRTRQRRLGEHDPPQQSVSHPIEFTGPGATRPAPLARPAGGAARSSNSTVRQTD